MLKLSQRLCAYRLSLDPNLWILVKFDVFYYLFFAKIDDLFALGHFYVVLFVLVLLGR